LQLETTKSINQPTMTTSKKASYNSLSSADGASGDDSATRLTKSGGRINSSDRLTTYSSTNSGSGNSSNNRHHRRHDKGDGGGSGGAVRSSKTWLKSNCGLLFEDCSPLKIIVLVLVLALIGIVIFDEYHHAGADDTTVTITTTSIKNKSSALGISPNIDIVDADADSDDAIINNSIVANENDEGEDEDDEATTNSSTMQNADNNIITNLDDSHDDDEMDVIPMPSGVNIGSWLSLEDYFFAGRSSVEVATPFGKQIAACLPPLHVGTHTGPKWSSETDLLGNLTLMVDSTPGKSGRGLAHAVSVFQAHRNTFVDLDVDFARLAALGIKNIRLPMSWCWTDYDPRTVNLKNMTEDEVASKFTCEDPYFGPSVRWPAIPKALIEDILRACSKHGLKAALDVHTLPGGTSIGTFSGVWPQWPKFWTDGDVPSTDLGKRKNKVNLGHQLFSELVEWMEDLADRDPEAFDGLRGLSPMNEPAHLAGLFGGSNHDPVKNFLPPLPPDLAQDYLDELSSLAYSPTNSTEVPDGTHLRVFYWFKGALEIFRNSKLPSLGKQLHANIIESILAKELLPDEDGSKADGARRPGALKIIASWWCSESTTSPDERSDWAVLDTHHYHAWEKACQGSVDGQDASYACGDIKTRHKVLEKCTQWSPTFRGIVDQECGKGAQLMSAEFSASSHHSVRHSCNDVSNLRESYVMQVEAAKQADVELFYWSYHMPNGGAFRRAWSFQHLMYLLGVLDRPDEPQFGCNDHIADSEEPNDDVFEPSS
jgi:hypothetical protein